LTGELVIGVAQVVGGLNFERFSMVLIGDDIFLFDLVLVWCLTGLGFCPTDLFEGS